MTSSFKFSAYPTAAEPTFPANGHHVSQLRNGLTITMDRRVLTEPEILRLTAASSRAQALGKVANIDPAAVDHQTEVDFEDQRAAWLLAKTAVQNSFEIGGAPEDHFPEEEREIVRYMAAGFLEVATEAHVLKETPDLSPASLVDSA